MYTPQLLNIDGRFRAKLGVFCQNVMAALDLFVLKKEGGGEGGRGNDHQIMAF